MDDIDDPEKTEQVDEVQSSRAEELDEGELARVSL